MKLALMLMASLAFGQECHMEPHGSGLVVCSSAKDVVMNGTGGIIISDPKSVALAKLEAEIEIRRAILKAAEAELRDALARRAKLLEGTQ